MCLHIFYNHSIKIKREINAISIMYYQEAYPVALGTYECMKSISVLYEFICTSLDTNATLITACRQVYLLYDG